MADHLATCARCAWRQAWHGVRRDDHGQDLAEYAILIALIALVVIGAVTAFGGELVALYQHITATLPFPAGSS